MPWSSLRNTLLVTAVIFSVGCGGSSSGHNSTSLDFKTSGTYDLRQYIVPAQNQLSTFVERTYKDTEGNHIYGSMPTATSELTQRYEVGNNSVKIYDGHGQLDTTYTITQTAITQQISDPNSLQFDAVVTMVRFANLGDPVANNILNTPVPNAADDIAMTLTCSLKDHFDSKSLNTKTYDDVIAVACQGFTDTDIAYQDTPMSISITNTTTFYYAKSIGEIGSVNENCYMISSAQTAQTVQQCSKTVSEITSIL